MPSSKLHVRKIPFDFKSVVDQPWFNFAWLENSFDGGRPALLYALGVSLYVELWEQINITYQKMYKGTEKETVRDFISQEARHAGYHRILNSRIIDPRYDRHAILGSVNHTAMPVLLSRMELLLRELNRNPGDMKLRKTVYRRIAAFETSISMMNSLLTMEVLDQRGPHAFAVHAPFHYLFFYHFAEELEHLDVPVEVYEETFQEELWSANVFDSTYRDILEGRNEIIHFVLCTAKKLGVDVTMDEIENIEHVAIQNRRMRDWIQPGWNLSKFDEDRRTLIRKWDDEWEPAMRLEVARLVGMMDSSLPSPSTKEIA